MLVLTRKMGERIQIGDSIIVTVVRTGRANVRIGVEAPERVRILRDETADLPPSDRESA